MHFAKHGIWHSQKKISATLGTLQPGDDYERRRNLTPKGIVDTADRQLLPIKLNSQNSPK
jgi:hypothetical protein